MVFGIIITGCLTTPEPQDPLQFELLFQVDELGEAFTRGDDSISIDEFKFSIDRFNLIAEDSLILASSNQIDSIIFFYTKDIKNENLVLSVNLGYEDIDLFEGYEMFLRPVEEFDDIDDFDFFGETDNYSIIAKGEYNGEDFVYNSSLSFDRSEDIGAIQVGQRNETLVIKKRVVISDLFISDNDSIIDPTNKENETLINNLFEEKLIIDGYSLTRIVDIE